MYAKQQLGMFRRRLATDAAVSRGGITLQVDDEAVVDHGRCQWQQLRVLAAFPHQSYQAFDARRVQPVAGGDAEQQQLAVQRAEGIVLAGGGFAIPAAILHVAVQAVAIEPEAGWQVAVAEGMGAQHLDGAGQTVGAGVDLAFVAAEKAVAARLLLQGLFGLVQSAGGQRLGQHHGKQRLLRLRGVQAAGQFQQCRQQTVGLGALCRQQGGVAAAQCGVQLAQQGLGGGKGLARTVLAGLFAACAHQVGKFDCFGQIDGHDEGQHIQGTSSGSGEMAGSARAGSRALCLLSGGRKGVLAAFWQECAYSRKRPDIQSGLANAAAAYFHTGFGGVPSEVVMIS